MNAMPDASRAGERPSPRAWTDVYQSLRGEPDLSPDELDALGEAAWWLRHPEEALDIKRRAYLGHVEQDAPTRAALTAWWLFYGHLYWGQRSQAAGWLRRMRRHLEGIPESVEHGYLAFAEADISLQRGELDAALAAAERALELGVRFKEPNVTAMALHLQGRALITRGVLSDGLGALDESVTMITGGEVSDLLTGSIYCGAVHICRDLADLGRVVEWTEAMRGWYEGLPIPTPYHGLCRVYRGEVLALCGLWKEAEADLSDAAKALIDIRPRAAAEAVYVLGELLRRRGKSREATEAFARASELGRDPQPGRALLDASLGQAKAAASSLDTSLARPVAGPFVRSQLLAARVEVALAMGDVEGAGNRAAELDELASRIGGQALRAAARFASGSVHLATGDAEDAVAQLAEACSLWGDLGLPYEQAKAQAALGTARVEMGDAEGGRAELAAARATLARLGAELDDRGRVVSRVNIPGGLSPRELEVLRLVAAGHTNREIAELLVISEHTVRRHVQNIFAKLGVRSRTAAASFAHEHRLV